LTAAHESLWEYIHDLYARMASASPAGKHAVVEIETNDGRTLEPKAVQAYAPFLVCDLAQEEAELVAVRETDIRRIRIYVAGEDEKVPVGFRVGELELE
jgi:hypothetical protein